MRKAQAAAERWLLPSVFSKFDVKMINYVAPVHPRATNMTYTLPERARVAAVNPPNHVANLLHGQTQRPFA